MTTEMTIDNHHFCLLNGVLTPEECQQFIKLLDVPDLHRVESTMATYDRNIMINEEFANVIYKRILPFLPPGTVRCNEYFRFSKYHPGQEFTKHTDGTNQDKYGNRSQYTLNIFLNKDFGGGETDFFDNSGRLAVRAVPEPGRAALFDRGILHCGNKVASGNKYLLRTDVMIPIPGVQQTPAEEKVFTYTAALHTPQ